MFGSENVSYGLHTCITYAESPKSDEYTAYRDQIQAPIFEQYFG